MTQLRERLNAPLKAIALASSAGLVLAGGASATEEPTTEPTETTSATAEPEATSGGSIGHEHVAHTPDSLDDLGVGRIGLDQ